MVLYNKNNRGFAMVIVLIIITVLFILSASLSLLISGEISVSSSNFKRINAKYNAETGIEEGIYNINTTDDPISVYPSQSYNGGNYKFEITTGGVISDYIIDSYGYYPSNENEKKITVYINEGDYEQGLIYGNQLSISGNPIESVTISDYFSHEDLDHMQYDPTDLYKEFIIKYYFDGDQTAYSDNKYEDNTINYNDYVPNYSLLDYNSDPDYVVKKENITDKDGNTHTFYMGYVYHYRSDLSITGHSQTEELTSESLDEIVSDDPTLVVVDGNLNITNIQKIQGFIFIVNKDINYNVSKAAKPLVNNSFFYTGNNFYYNKDVGNLTGEPFLDFNAQILAENDINIYIKNNSKTSAHYKSVNWPEDFNYNDYKKLYKVTSVIANWNE